MLIFYYVLFVLIGYLLGSIPSAVWIGKTFYNVDVREHGSHNAGATNTFRVLGKKPGAIVLLFDVLKGLIATLPPLLLLNYTEINSITGLDPYRISVGFASVIGHLFPVFAGFKGGKGVATSLGVVIGLHPFSAMVCLIVFSLFYFPTKYVSLGAISASISFPIAVFILNPNAGTLMISFSLFICFGILITHRKNIRRLLRKEENRMNFFK